jgi:hypothetical protein
VRSPLFSDAFKLLGLRVFFLVHELTGRAAVLCPVFLAFDRGLELRAFANSAFAGVIDNGFVDGHGSTFADKGTS